MEPLSFSDGNIFAEAKHLYTVSAAPGTRVYGERTPTVDGVEYREWNPQRSKLAAYIAKGGRCLPLRKGFNVLYLGASSGTTASHVSDLVNPGRVYCIEFAPRMFRDLIANCTPRPNMMPILADATQPQQYQFVVGSADVVYEDVAQKGQADILADNMEVFGAQYGMVAVKARSEDVTAAPATVFRKTEARLQERGLKILDVRSLEPFEVSHEMIVTEARS
ncbi:MAG: fibrillarin-like rRNA/tRNA 2'-O-methyltransferase [Candidatus Methanomethylophilus sp.]|nr:fibrillarin-like rRNA/tRNA 2'-O-methyltransferase [Methanomethylophilus sp.]MDD3232685.1 fibrillarin-like rRNA/tRNA 2'-O-methyltransferase [Methanomethylophilus sp.]MDD4221547.1 fibrillarin-like rRNA/tRNA 2'-O-methyltransferase [Methanomethylophilus sp.]MDD4668376.1 fibrillarin-like rRNA/tRNA 2'-O-methyltransferase [Methanomethylophilus sp.]